jgi:hypothetical protein
MSRQLPARPNLEHLRKQAKDLLPVLQQRDPAAQLADAQHTIAREYGFASWPKLKAHVDSLSVMVPEPQNPFVGRWKANLGKSTRHPAQDFQSAVAEFDVSGNEVTITDVVVDASGREERHVNTIQADGREHLSPSGNGYSLLATWQESRVLETVAKKDGAVVGWGRYEVTSDGSTLIMSGDQLRIVCDRVT